MKNENGFALMESIICVVLLSVLVTGFYQAIASIMNSADRIKNYSDATHNFIMRQEGFEPNDDVIIKEEQSEVTLTIVESGLTLVQSRLSYDDESQNAGVYRYIRGDRGGAEAER